MSLIKCPECELSVSDKAFACPHCGYPFQEIKQLPVRRSTSKRKRLPNGFGQITELKNRNLRKPFRAMVTVGFTDLGKPICKILQPEGYFKTYNEAYEALLNYGKSPYMVNTNITLDEVFQQYYKDLINDTEGGDYKHRHIRSLWKKLEVIHKMMVKDLTPYCIKEVLNNVNTTVKTKIRLKSLLNVVLDYAVQMDYIDKNVSRSFKFSKNELKGRELIDHHIDFTANEFNIIFKNTDNEYIFDIMKIQCLMGWRPQELCDLLVKNVDLENWTIMGGMKTAAGTNRIVPIHTSIRSIVKKFYEQSIKYKSEYLILCTDTYGKEFVNMTYDLYRKRFRNLIEKYKMNLDHRPHDCRVQFITMCKESGVDEYAIKYMAGHSIHDITESVYTKRKKEWYANEIEKIIVSTD